MKSRFWIQARESSAALAFEKSVGLIPPGAVKVIGAAGTGAGGLAGVEEGKTKVDGKTWELAAPLRSKPPAPAAPRRNISLRFNALYPPLSMPRLIPVKRLTADNPLRIAACVHPAGQTVRRAKRNP